MSTSLSILSTKILDDGSREFARARGWHLREEAFIDIQPLYPSQLPPDWVKIVTAIDEQTLVIFTSENAVHALPYLSEGQWRIACLHGKTKEEVALRFNTARVVVTAGSAKELAMAIAQDGLFRKAVFFCALEHRPELPRILAEADIALEELPVYQTTHRPRLIEDHIDGVLFFSPSAVESFFSINRLSTDTVCFAIGSTTAAAVKEFSDVRVVTSREPLQKTLLEGVQFFYDNQL